MMNGAEVAKHNTAEDLWMIVNGQVYDLTGFPHPGGQRILLKYAGKDATEPYEEVHPPGTIENNLPKDKHLGPVDMSTVDKVVEKVEERSKQEGPSLVNCLNLDDFEKAAEQMLKTKAWAYYRSAADDELTHDWNRRSYSRLRLRPRVMRDVSTVHLTTTILGHKSELPFFIAPAAMGRLAHPEGEKCLARGAKLYGIPYVVSANSSVSMEELAAQGADQTLFYQLYVNKDRKKTEEQLKRVVKAGFKAIIVTVDAPVAGKRERDERTKLDLDAADDPSMRKAVAATAPDAPDRPQQNPAAQGIAQTLGSYVDPALQWTDIAWMKRVTGGLPIVVKGIQSAEDAALATHYGASAIYLSNHGGRQLEGAPSSLETLLEIRKYEPWILDSKTEIWCDGGVRRGTDIVKLLALGAKAVGIGRPFMYSLAFGDDGVNQVATILRDELAQNVRLVGSTKLSQLEPSLVNASELEQDIYNGPYDSPVKTVLAKL
ncbi:FMN-dependent alpha-hydroxy acid dehydrogenase [Sporobolomyces salmoneus]|uniref:FMN-dependent alpha-hydroxy acid dehydrogenase n=1 Tax=Sporobolomyces salmoneus TaxID=183962 RepID=UPI00317332C5